MKKIIIYLLALFSVGCSDVRSFEGKNVYGSQSSASSSTSSGYTEHPWPEGPPGVGLGQVVPEQMAWQGFRENQSTPSPTTLWPRDWYDPTGELGIDAVMIVVAKHDCAKCKDEASMIENYMGTWDSQGRMIKITTLLVDGKDGSIADWTDALEWKKTYFQIDASVGADPLSTFLPETLFALPYHVVVNPRTMRIVQTQEGIIDDYLKLEKLADENKQ